MNNTKIEWTDSTWNPATGCSKISSGCKNCYAERMSKRLQSMGTTKYANGFNLTLHPLTLIEPYSWKSPRMVFVNSMSDLFHENMPNDYILEVFKVMNENQRHVFQVLTKRADRLLELNDKINWTDNIWMGTTVENNEQIHRISKLSETKAKIKFLSCEPLLSAIPKMNLSAIDWVIVGGESGPGARPIEVEWVVNIKQQCIKSNTPFFFKQWGGKNKKKNGRLLDGQIYSEMPLTYSL